MRGSESYLEGVSGSARECEGVTGSDRDFGECGESGEVRGL